VPPAEFRRFRATSNTQKGTPGDANQQLICGLTSQVSDCPSSENGSRWASQAENAGSIRVARSRLDLLRSILLQVVAGSDQFWTVMLKPELKPLPAELEASATRTYGPSGTVCVFQLHNHP
jgi:hypothetical protein